jgi:hypothetical protein
MDTRDPNTGALLVAPPAPVPLDTAAALLEAAGAGAGAELVQRALLPRCRLVQESALRMACCASAAFVRVTEAEAWQNCVLVLPPGGPLPDH